MIIKPASETPLTMLALMPILEEAGVPPGVVNVLPSRSSGAVVSKMLSDGRIRVISLQVQLTLAESYSMQPQIM